LTITNHYVINIELALKQCGHILDPATPPKEEKETMNDFEQFPPIEGNNTSIACPMIIIGMIVVSVLIFLF